VVSAAQIKIIELLYLKLCDCRRDYPELDDLLNPVFHLEECPYREVMEKEDIQWN
jgi:hypothetical protein